MNRHILRLIPREITLDNFKTLFETIPFWKQFMNSFCVAAAAAVLAMLVDGLVAYGFTRFEFRGKGILMSLILATMLIPPQVLMVPQFQMYKTMGLFGSLCTPDHTGTDKRIWNISAVSDHGTDSKRFI